MKRLFATAALLGAAVLPATQAAAVPPGNTSVPLGAPTGCLILDVPVSNTITASCSFVGAGASPIGMKGLTTGTFTLSHKKKVAICNQATRTVSSIILTTVTDHKSSGIMNFDEAYTSGIVYTLAMDGDGFAVVGSPGAPSADSVNDPAVGPAPAYTGAEDGTGGKAVGSAC